MKQPMVVTNLRIPQSDYLQIKAIAGELGMSVNEYVSSIIKSNTRKRMMRHDVLLSTKKKRQSLWKAMDRIAKIKGKPMGWSAEDEAIYSV